MSEQNFDVVIIGGGPGGYVAAIRGAQLGLKVACIDKRKTLGGTCLNVGCIPSKALLNSSEKFEEASHHLEAHGVKVKGVSLDLKAMMANKEKIVDDLTKGIDFLLKKNKVTRYTGTGKITGANQVSITDDKGKTESISTKNIVIATGSIPTSLPGIDIDEKKIVSSTGALSLPTVPKRMVVIGAGYIGLEMGSVWQRLGAQVTVVEFLDRITPTMDQECAKSLQKVLSKQGMSFKLGTKVTKVDSSKSGLKLSLEPADGKGKNETLEADVVLVSTGRRPFTDGLGLEEVGVQTDDRGFVQVNEHYQTTAPSVFAIGDAIPGPMLAHKAEEEGVAVMEMLSGQHPHVNYNVIPGVIYTHPEVASVGKTEEELKAEGATYSVGKFPLMANSRARAMGSTDGFVKILADKETDYVLGVHIIGPEAGNMIAEAAVAMEFRASSEDIARTCHAHPTLNEAIKEAALDVANRAIHI